MNFEIVFVLLALVGMIAALIWDGLRSGMVLLTVVVLFLCAGILTPKEMLEGFSNKGMITVGMLFLVSEGIRQSGALGQLIKKLLPEGKTTVFKAQLRMLPPIAFVSAFLNNTPVVVIFAPIIKRWAESVKLPATKFLIPLSYVTILGGICTLIGTSTNLVVHGMILEAGYEGFTMFELGRVGIFIALAGIIYLFVFSNKLLPDSRTDRYEEDEEDGNPGNTVDDKGCPFLHVRGEQHIQQIVHIVLLLQGFHKQRVEILVWRLGGIVPFPAAQQVSIVA